MITREERVRPRTALVTGGARGIGAAIAGMFAAEGVQVAVLDIDAVSAEQTTKTLLAAGATAFGVVADITDRDSFRQAFSKVENELGPVDILVNNAGWTPNTPFIDMTESEWAKVININYLGTLHGCRIALDSMIANRSGRIINISSDAARVGTPKESVYAGAKAAVIGFSKSLAVEVAGQGITVNVVCPGTTGTTLLRSMLTDEQMQRRLKANPMGRIGVPEDVAAAVLFFSSPAASYITGQVLSVNGGMTRVG